MLTLFALILVLVGCANWLTIGLLQFDFVAGLFGSQSNIFSRIVYVIVGVAAVVLTVNIIKNKGKLAFNFKKLKFGQKAEPKKRLATAKAESAEDFSKDDFDKDDNYNHTHEQYEKDNSPRNNQRFSQEMAKDNYNNRYKDLSNRLSEQHKNNNSKN